MTDMKKLNRYVSLALFAFTCLSSAGVQAGKLYKWVDENGQVRYGDAIPAKYAKKRNETLNKEGIVVDHKAAAKTRAQLAEEERIKKAEAEEERIRREKAYQDRILLDTFTNEDEMVMTRDGKIEAIEAVIRITKGRTEKLKQRLGELQRTAANMERAGRPVSDNIKKDIAESRDQLDQNRRYVVNRQAEQEKIRDKFEADIKRFRELKTAQAAEAEK
ncbi:MAG: DUF4124 domain-containing protein [Thiogranum sp.]|jgi:hypothetical protein|nr:DUF4124 domain-containing protein [Thiogranum sp.]